MAFVELKSPRETDKVEVNGRTFIGISSNQEIHLDEYSLDDVSFFDQNGLLRIQLDSMNSIVIIPGDDNQSLENLVFFSDQPDGLPVRQLLADASNVEDLQLGLMNRIFAPELLGDEESDLFDPTIANRFTASELDGRLSASNDALSSLESLPPPDDLGSTPFDPLGSIFQSGLLNEIVIPDIFIADAVVKEETGSVFIEVSLSEPTTVFVTVDFILLPRSAEANLDFADLNGRVTFAPGETKQLIEVAVIDDNLFEDTEVFVVQLLEPVNGHLIDDKAEVTIIDNDNIEVIINNATAPESDGELVFLVQLSSLAPVPIVFDFATMEGTALNNFDFLPEAETLVIPAGMDSAQITILTVDDQINEPNEFLNLVASNLTPIASFANTVATGTIENDFDILFPLEQLEVGDGSQGTIFNGFDVLGTVGFSLSDGGDINGDGFGDFLLGGPIAIIESDGQRGRSFALFGRPEGFGPEFELIQLLAANGGDGTQGFAVDGGDFDETNGTSLGTEDVNGDGFFDVLIAANEANFNELTSDFGGVYVIFGRSAGFFADVNALDFLPVNGGDGEFAITIPGKNPNDTIGDGVDGLGDVNGDNIPDFIVGGQGVNGTNINTGEAYVIFGDTSGFPVLFDLNTLNGMNGFTLNGPDQISGELFGGDSAGPGDINGDGINDIIVSANGALNNNGIETGRVFVLFGTDQPYPATFDVLTLDGNNGGDGSLGFTINGFVSEINSTTGSSLSILGDVNNDGIDDLGIGAFSDDINGIVNAGQLFVLFGRNTGFPSDFDLADLLPENGGDGSEGFVVQGIADNSFLGSEVDTIGDTNGDGIDDFIIGAFGVNGNDGQAIVIFGQPDGVFDASIDLNTLDGSDGLILDGQDDNGFAGFAVSGAGDANGDGLSDFLIGSILAEGSPQMGSTVSTGEVALVFGSNFSNSISQEFTEGDDILIGTGESDNLIGGLGNDLLIGNGGPDNLSGGSGNDSIVISDNLFTNINGGGGTDFLNLTGDGFSLDLTQVSDNRVSGIDFIDLSADGMQQIELNANDLFSLTEADNLLLITGNADDRVIADLSGAGFNFILGPDDGGFNQFQSETAFLLIEATISQTVIL